MKKVAFTMPPKPKSADEWIGGLRGAPPTRTAPSEPMKRFTIDVPESLHMRVKLECTQRKAKMADVLREILDREFPKR